MPSFRDHVECWDDQAAVDHFLESFPKAVNQGVNDGIDIAIIIIWARVLPSFIMATTSCAGYNLYSETQAARSIRELGGGIAGDTGIAGVAAEVG